MVFNQELDELAILLGQPVAPREAARICRAEVRMIAATAFGDVVVKRAHIEEPAPLEAARELAAERELVREFGLREAAQVPDHHEDVLVHGVDVEEVVLHLADDAAEFRQIPAEDAVLIHASELVHDAARLLQDVHEHEARELVLPETGIDTATRAV